MPDIVRFQRGGFRKEAKFLSENNTFFKSKVIKMIFCKNFATLQNPPLDLIRIIKSITIKTLTIF